MKKRIQSRLSRTLLLIGLITLWSSFVSATELLLYIDNDAIVGTDEEYTGGAGAVFDFHGFSLNYQYMLFTPQNTRTTTPLAGERPYAAYEKFGLRYRNNVKFVYFNVGAFAARTGDKLKGEFIQNTIHEEIAEERGDAEHIDPGEVFTHGWPTQISNESGGQFDGQAGLFHEVGDSFAILVYGHGETGDFIRSSGLGATSRVGFQIDKFSDNNYAPKNAFFLELDYKFKKMSKNNLLEGNESSYLYGVDSEDDVHKASASLVSVWGGFTLRVGAAYITHEYETQPANDASSHGHLYGTVGLGYRWK